MNNLQISVPDGYKKSIKRNDNQDLWKFADINEIFSIRQDFEGCTWSLQTDIAESSRDGRASAASLSSVMMALV